jgi:hypothetical protein
VDFGAGESKQNAPALTSKHSRYEVVTNDVFIDMLYTLLFCEKVRKKCNPTMTTATASNKNVVDGTSLHQRSPITSLCRRKVRVSRTDPQTEKRECSKIFAQSEDSKCGIWWAILTAPPVVGKSVRTQSSNSCMSRVCTVLYCTVQYCTVLYRSKGDRISLGKVHPIPKMGTRGERESRMLQE